MKIDQNLQSLEKWLVLLAREGVEFALFPELAISGYINNKKLLQEYVECHARVIQEIKELSLNCSVIFSIGFPIPVKEGWGIGQVTWYNGQVIDTHVKTHLSTREKEVFVVGDNMSVFSIDGMKLGIQLCLESHFPELSIVQQKQGAEVLCYAFASPRETPSEKRERFLMYLRARAYDNCCFVVACNQVGKTCSGMDYAGVAFILSPRGEILAESIGYQENYCTYDIDLNDIVKIKNSKMGYFPGQRRV